MHISPISIGVGAGIAAGVGSTFVGMKLGDRAAERHPSGSGSDTPATLTSIGIGAAGVLAAAGGMAALTKGHEALGAAGFGAGAGMLIGAFASGLVFTARHGVGVDTSIDRILSSYDRDGDRQLDLNPRWRTPEYVRKEVTRHEDSDGDTHEHVDYYTIQRLTQAANVDHDGVVTRSELRDTIGGYDADGDGRLKGNELRSFDRELGEESWWGNWVF